VFDGGDWNGDACTMPDFSLHLTDSGDVLYNSSADIAGFQFDVDGLLSASGGDAEAAGFTVSSGAQTVLAFSFTGSVIPAGCGTLVELDLDGDTEGLYNIVVSGSNGVGLDFMYYEGDDDEGPPECLEDCAGIEDIGDVEDDPDGFCEWFIPSMTTGCQEDCDTELLGEIEEILAACEECLVIQYRNLLDILLSSKE
jgi:hypothetical protein